MFWKIEEGGRFSSRPSSGKEGRAERTPDAARVKVLAKSAALLSVSTPDAARVKVLAKSAALLSVSTPDAARAKVLAKSAALLSEGVGEGRP